MAKSQNLRFQGTPSDDSELKKPQGGSLIRLIKEKLQNSGWDSSEFKPQEDGWSITSKRSNVEVKMGLTALGKSEWALHISPSFIPGFIDRLLKKQASALQSDIFELAKEVHSIITAENKYSKLMWCWDEFPEDDNSSAEPKKN
jgi:hypothetical protein